uniref:Uncharacterized protein n=1 Tax=Megaselia scalaris TaxID=36166 RepID=T1GJ31_MEGSC
MTHLLHFVQVFLQALLDTDFCTVNLLLYSLTLNIWEKWKNNPVIVSFAEKSTPVWQIPFPAVTVCPETKARQTVFNFTKVYADMTNKAINYTLSDEESSYLEAIFQICQSHMIQNTGFGSNISSASELVEIFEIIQPPFLESYFNCRWRNKKRNCESSFHKFLTEEGICYTFNSPDQTNIFREESHIPEFVFNTENISESTWTLEKGYTNFDFTNEQFPIRVMAAGSRGGLFLELKGKKIDYDMMCRGPVPGFKILLHTPGEIPQVSRQYLRVPYDQEVLIAIKPKIITTSNGLMGYEPARRQCFFQNEKYLRFFKLYTQNNCEVECIANYTLTRCGCVKFSMPRNETTPVCGAAKITCYNQAEDELLQEEFIEGLQTSKLNYRGETKCNCLPSCTEIVYDAEISQAEYDFHAQMRALGLHDYNGNGQISSVFQRESFLTSRRSELYGTTDFLANVGGLLGLFMGVSMISFVELVYFCTVRLISNLRMRRRNLVELKSLESAKQELDKEDLTARKRSFRNKYFFN